MLLGVPTLNRYDLLERLIGSAERGSERPTGYFVVDNGGRWAVPAALSALHMEILRPAQNLGVAASWNRILDRAGSDPVLISNDDIEFGMDTVCLLLQALGREPFASALGFAIFAQKRSVTDRVGFYDEHFFPAYYEDNDYEHRMALAKIRRVNVQSMGLSHVGWATSRALGMRGHHDWYARNLKYYTEKWGGPPGGERFDAPFDGSPPSGWTERVVVP